MAAASKALSIRAPLSTSASRSLYTSFEGDPALQAWARDAFPASQYHVVDYDALVKDTQGTLDETFRWLGLEPVTVHSTFVKTSKGLNDSIANLDDVRAALKGTKWEI